MWATWVVDLISETTPGKIGIENAFTADGPEGGAREIIWVSDRISAEAKAVCGSCNSGWMSDLESSIAGFLRPQIASGEPILLDPERQLKIAAWSTKIAMMFEFVNPAKAPYYTDEQRQYLKDNLIPPTSVVGVWVGRYEGRKLGCQHLSVTLGEPGKPAFARSSTLSVGEFAAQILAYDLGTLRAQDDQVPCASGPWANSLVQIWPDSTEAVFWPLPSMDFDTLRRLAYRFGVGARLHAGARSPRQALGLR